MSGFELQRLGMLMEPQPGDPQEAEGVMNPAAARGPDSELYLFPRLVAHGNYSRIGIARVRFNEAGDPAGVDRLGIVLEPETDYERGIDGHGGCEDPRITFVEPLQHYLMTYTARSPHGPRIAAACSTDLFHWKRLGLVPFAPFEGLDLSNVDDKDACPFPAAIPNPSGQPELAMLHRPLFPGTARRKRHPPPPPPRGTLIAKASGFPTARFPWRLSNRVSPISFLIIGWRLRYRLGNASKSVAALHRSSPGTAGWSFTTALAKLGDPAIVCTTCVIRPE